MAKAKKKTVGIAVLDEAAQEMFDKYLKQSRLASRGRRATNVSRELRDEIVKLMDGAPLAQLPDGRQIMAVPKEAEYDAKPAATIKWVELNELHVAE